jgi:hypothetical protein
VLGAGGHGSDFQKHPPTILITRDQHLALVRGEDSSGLRPPESALASAARADGPPERPLPGQSGRPRALETISLATLS